VLRQGVDGYAGVSDTYITADYSDMQYSTSPLNVRGDGNYVSLIRFELPDSLSNRHIIQASLELRTIYRSAILPCSVGAYAMKRPWVDSEATWLNASRNQPWVQPGAKSSLDSDTVLIDQRQLNSDNATYTFDITTIVQSWAAGTQSNYGILLRRTATASVTYRFASSEHTSTAYRPRLTIIHAPIVPTATATQTSPATPTRTITPTVIPSATPRISPTPSITAPATATLMPSVTPIHGRWYTFFPEVVRRHRLDWWYPIQLNLQSWGTR